MPIDPNIALGVRPIEQPNMLGQMAQAMAIRQANQEYENEGGLRNALTSGATEDPSSLLQYGKQGRATYESILKGKKEHPYGSFGVNSRVVFDSSLFFQQRSDLRAIDRDIQLSYLKQEQEKLALKPQFGVNK
jgi:hypothetical protein